MVHLSVPWWLVLEDRKLCGLDPGLDDPVPSGPMVYYSGLTGLNLLTINRVDTTLIYIGNILFDHIFQHLSAFRSIDYIYTSGLMDFTHSWTH